MAYGGTQPDTALEMHFHQCMEVHQKHPVLTYEGQIWPLTDTDFPAHTMHEAGHAVTKTIGAGCVPWLSPPLPITPKCIPLNCCHAFAQHTKVTLSRTLKRRYRNSATGGAWPPQPACRGRLGKSPHKISVLWSMEKQQAVCLRGRKNIGIY